MGFSLGLQVPPRNSLAPGYWDHFLYQVYIPTTTFKNSDRTILDRGTSETEEQNISPRSFFNFKKIDRNFYFREILQFLIYFKLVIIFIFLKSWKFLFYIFIFYILFLGQYEQGQSQEMRDHRDIDWTGSFYDPVENFVCFQTT